MNPMITRLHLKNFKSHQDSSLRFSNLTVLTGFNSAGKSSVLQSLLLLRQSYRKGRLHAGLDLNSPLCNLGKGADVLFRFAETDMITISLSISSGATFDLRFDVGERNLFHTFIPLQENAPLPAALSGLSLFGNDFQYLSALRWAGRSWYPVDTYAVETERQLSLDYGQGELVAHFLEYYGRNRNFSVEAASVLHPAAPADRSLLAQTIAWEREISPRIRIKAEQRAGQVTLEYGFEGGGTALPLTELRSENIGFGISYSLPVVVALLSARPGALLLLENPEAHLHPSGQARLAELMARVARTGVQVVIETHSDHIFNGVRKALKKGWLRPEETAVHYFRLGEANHTEPVEIRLDASGRILNYERGLFDQFDDDLDELLDLNRTDDVYLPE